MTELRALLGWYRKSDHPALTEWELIGVFDWPEGDDRWLSVAFAHRGKFESFKRVRCELNKPIGAS